MIHTASVPNWYNIDFSWIESEEKLKLYTKLNCSGTEIAKKGCDIKILFRIKLQKEKKMKQLLQTIIRNVKSVRGNSLAEFATTTALMATLAATAAPKLSEMSEGAKGEKSRNEIDKIVKMAGQFYQDVADTEGRGRFPNQVKFNVPIGDSESNGGDSDENTAGVQYSLTSDQTNSEAHTDKILKDLGLDPSFSSLTEGWDLSLIHI